MKRDYDTRRDTNWEPGMPGAQRMGFDISRIEITGNPYGNQANEGDQVDDLLVVLITDPILEECSASCIELTQVASLKRALWTVLADRKNQMIEISLYEMGVGDPEDTNYKYPKALKRVSKKAFKRFWKRTDERDRVT